MTAQLYDAPGVNYDVRKLAWLARVSSEAKVALLGPKSPYNSVADMAKSATAGDLGGLRARSTAIPISPPSWATRSA